MQFERSEACNYSAHIFLPIVFGVCAGIIYSFFHVGVGMDMDVSTALRIVLIGSPWLVDLDGLGAHVVSMTIPIIGHSMC